MTKSEKAILQQLQQALQNRTPEQIVDYLWRSSLLNRTAIERLAIRKEYNQLVKQGMARCSAMESIAAKYCCSYEKIRFIIYKKE